MDQPSVIPYELRIGVTGHRDLANPAAVREAVEELLGHIEKTLTSSAQYPRGPTGAPHTWLQWWEEQLARGLQGLCGLLRLVPVLRRVFPRVPIAPKITLTESRTPIQWTVLSALAKGADQIVADAVLDGAASGCDSSDQPRRLKAVLPFPRQEYEKDFQGKPRDDFNRLVALDPAPTVADPENDNAAPDDEASPRQKCYRAAGHLVAGAAEILIAVWDGRSFDKPGGTGDIVKWAVGRGKRVYWIDATNPSKPARVITGLEIKQPEPESESSSRPKIAHINTRPLPTTAKAISWNFHRLTAFNRDPAFDAARCREIVENHRAKMEQTAAKARLPAHILEPIFAGLLPLYARASQMADAYQRLYRFAGKGIPILSAAAVSVVAFQVLFLPDAHQLIWAEVALMLLAAALLRITRNERWHEKWLNDRHLAERLRAAMHMVLATSQYGLSQVHPERLLPFYAGPDVWFLGPLDAVVRQTKQQVGDLAASPELLGPLRRFVSDSWIRSQATWHQENADKKSRTLKRGYLLGLGLVLLILAAAVLHALGVGHGADEEGGWRLAQPHLWIALLAIALPAWAAAGHAIDSLLDFERIAERSRRMVPKLSTTAALAENAATFKALSDAAVEAEEIIAIENLEWLASLSFQRPEFRG